VETSDITPREWYPPLNGHICCDQRSAGRNGICRRAETILPFNNQDGPSLLHAAFPLHPHRFSFDRLSLSLSFASALA
jgi:hypothetical protein